MERSLTALLPVENAQSSLADTVARLLEVLPELTESFELLVIDDGSTDATIEVADELEVQYPQVRVVHHGIRRGRGAALRSGAARSESDVLFVADEDCRLPMTEVVKLWKAVDTHQVVLANAITSDEPESHSERTPDKSGFQMLSRKASEPLFGSLANQAKLRTKMSELGLSWHEIELTEGIPTATADSAQARPKRPNFLATAKEVPVG